MRKILLKVFLFCVMTINIQAQQNLVCSDVGMNLFYVNYWSREVPFGNLMMQASPWQACNNDWKFDEKDNYLISDKIQVDANGYPTHLPQSIAGQSKPQIAKTVVAWDNGGILPKGTYTLRYEGDGEIELFGLDTITILKKQNGQIEFDLKAIRVLDKNTFGLKGGGLGFVIRKSTLGNPIRNIRILLPTVKETDATYPFNPTFLQKLSPFKAIRFMNWAGAYWSLDEKWINRRQSTYYTQFNMHDWRENRSVAYEYMIKLCNVLNRDMWLSVPYKADENYIAELGKMILKDLKPNLKIYLEYGNEVWNVAFPYNIQYGHVQDNAPASLQNQDHQYRYAYFANRTFKAFDPAKSARVIRVISGQQASPSVLERSVQGMAFIAATGEFDKGSVTDYFVQSAAIQSLPPNPTVKDVAKAYRQKMQESINYIKANATIVGAMNKQMLSYEGGVHAIVSPGDPNEKVLLEFAKDTSFYNISKEWLQQTNTLSSLELHMAFCLADDEYGHWTLQNIFDPKPSSSTKYKALIDYCGVTINTQDVNNQLLAKVFPNPINDELFIQTETEQTLNLSLYDLTGRLLLSQKNYFSNSPLQIGFLEKGLYLLMIESEGKRRVERIVKY